MDWKTLLQPSKEKIILALIFVAIAIFALSRPCIFIHGPNNAFYCSPPFAITFNGILFFYFPIFLIAYAFEVFRSGLGLSIPLAILIAESYVFAGLFFWIAKKHETVGKVLGVLIGILFVTVLFAWITRFIFFHALPWAGFA